MENKNEQSQSGGHIHLDELPQLKRAYNKAVKENKTEFTFKGNVLLVSYAKYVIEYFESLKKP